MSRKQNHVKIVAAAVETVAAAVTAAAVETVAATVAAVAVTN